MPEQATHFGGLWEASVKCFKQHLIRVVGETKLTYEMLTTTLTQIEACLFLQPVTPPSGKFGGIGSADIKTFSYQQALNGFTKLVRVTSAHHYHMEVESLPKTYDPFLEQVVK